MSAAPQRLAALLLVPFAALGACTSARRHEPPRIEYRTSYYDRNGDGIVDFERHAAIGVTDADWTLADTDFDARYDEKTLIGYAITTGKVDQAVPRNVRLSRVPPHLR